MHAAGGEGQMNFTGALRRSGSSGGGDRCGFRGMEKLPRAA